MIIKNIRLQDYRNYEFLDLTLDPGTNVFYGDNAQGKTNILEAVFVGATTRSHRGTRDREIIRFEKEEAHIRIEAEKKEVPLRIDMHLKKGRSKGVAINGLPIRKVSELFGIINVIFFSPEDLSIKKNSPAERRHFMDMELCQLDPIYTYNLVSYNKIVTQRNKLLKDLDEKPELLDTLPVWDEQMVRYGSEIIARRRSFMEELSQIVENVHGNLTGGREHLSVSYHPNVQEDHFAQELSRSRARDLGARVSLAGPHRDDCDFIIDGIDARHFGSQGQQRTAALSLKLAEIELVKKRTKDNPILLLDDVLSELDSHRQTHLLSSISDIQTLVTCTGLDEFIQNSLTINRKFYVSNGTISVVD